MIGSAVSLATLRVSSQSFPALRSGGFEGLAALLSGELQDFRGRLCAQQMGEKIEGGAGVGAGEFDDFGRIVRRALRVGRISLQESIVDRARGHFHLFDVFLCLAHALLGESTKNVRRGKERHARVLLVGAGFRIGTYFLRIGLINASSSFQSNLN